MREELNRLHRNSTWGDGARVATTTQTKMHGIGSEWVFGAKLNPDGTTHIKT